MNAVAGLLMSKDFAGSTEHPGIRNYVDVSHPSERKSPASNESEESFLGGPFLAYTSIGYA